MTMIAPGSRHLLMGLAVFGILSGCSTATVSPTNEATPTPAASAASTATTTSAPTPYVRLGASAAPLPGVGDPVEMLGQGLTITLTKVIAWDTPAFLQEAAISDPTHACHYQLGDKVLAVEVRVEATASEAPTLLGLETTLIDGPPPGAQLVGVPGDDGFRIAIRPWCVNTPQLLRWDPSQLPIPPLSLTGQLQEGEVRVGWIAIAVQPDVLASGQLVFYVGVPPHKIEIRLSGA